MLSIRHFINTLGFLTRLAPARVISEKEMNQCMSYMPAVGLVLGIVVVLPFYAGLFSSSPWVQAWLMVALNIFLTRGLHYDGLADVCDAVTTHTDPARFWEVIKDSRAGAFGIIGLIMAIAGQIFLFHALIEAEKYTTIIWAFVLGRAACIAFSYRIRHLTRPGLGKLYIDGATLPVGLAAGITTFLLGLFLADPLTTVCGMTIAFLVQLPLYRLAEHVRGANGDFLGCSIMLGELSAGLGFLLFL